MNLLHLKSVNIKLVINQKILDPNNLHYLIKVILFNSMLVLSSGFRVFTTFIIGAREFTLLS